MRRNSFFIGGSQATSRARPQSPFPTARQSQRRLLITLFLVAVCLSLPFLLLLVRMHRQLEREERLELETRAKETITLVGRDIQALVDLEEARPFSDYQFIGVNEAPLLKTQQTIYSPLSRLPKESSIPGLVGYFQINPDYSISTPLLPDTKEIDLLTLVASYGISDSEVKERIKIQESLTDLLSLSPTNTNEKAKTEFRQEAKSISQAASAGQKKLQLQQNTISLENLIRDTTATNTQVGKQVARGMTRNEQLYLPRQTLELEQTRDDSIADSEAKFGHGEAPQFGARSDRSRRDTRQNQHEESQVAKKGSQKFVLQSFAGAIDPFFVIDLPQEHLLFFRRVWSKEKQFFQGFIARKKDFFGKFLQARLDEGLLQDSTIEVLFGEKGVAHYSSGRSEAENKQALARAPLPSPLQDFELQLMAQVAPSRSGKRAVNYFAAQFALALIIGLYLVYRLGKKEIALSQQRADFVSAVSHELKTPLTSIHMYSEMLREDWTKDEQRKRTYYDFIFQESERLTRLINNVLQLANLGSGSQAQLELELISANELLALAESKVHTQIMAAAFSLIVEPLEEAADIQILANRDAFCQIMINLVDNAVKFSAQAQRKEIHLGVRLRKKNEARGLEFFVRDFGPGISSTQWQKLFQPFYRGEGELTRSTRGTGIGLALVKSLAQAMGASIAGENCHPGAEFSLAFLAAQ